jgi:hypothetical protein
MDDLVRQAMAKWPHVPACYGWLGLDARGQWYMRDDRTQALGGFASALPGAKGARLQHAKLIDFIARNYALDEAGRAYFQNGPQRVFVELESTPWVWRLHDDGRVQDHCGQWATVQGGVVDELGLLYLATERGLGRLHSQDMHLALEPLEHGRWPLQELRQADLPARFGFVLSPAAQARDR